MNELSRLSSAIYNCIKENECGFNELKDARYCGGYGTDHRVMFIAESPSTSGGTGKFFKAEDNFSTTRADQLFKEIRKRHGLEDCYVTDLVKCGVKSDKPTLIKINNCREYLLREISYIKPKIIVAVGMFITYKDNGKKIVRPFDEFLKEHLGKIDTPIIKTYHYSYMNRYKSNNEDAINRYFKQHEEVLNLLKCL